MISGCASNNHDAKQNSNHEGKIREMVIAVEIFNSNYVFSDESMINVGEITYSVRQKAIYGISGAIQKLIVYKPEGRLEYNEEQILRDTQLIGNYGFPVKQNWRRMSDVLTDEKGNYVSRITWVAGSIYKAENDQYTILE